MDIKHLKELIKAEQNKMVTELQSEVHELKGKVRDLESKLEPTGLDDSREEAERLYEKIQALGDDALDDGNIGATYSNDSREANDYKIGFRPFKQGRMVTLGRKKKVNIRNMEEWLLKEKAVDKGNIESVRFSIHFKDKAERALFINGCKVVADEDVFTIESAGQMTNDSSYDEIKELLKGSVGIEYVEELFLYSNGSFKTNFYVL